jgi:phosphoglycolate phosphatase
MDAVLAEAQVGAHGPQLVEQPGPRRVHRPAPFTSACQPLAAGRKRPENDPIMYACLFDIDGTLISSGGAGKAALEKALATEFGIEHLIEKLSLSGRTDRAIIQDLFRLHALPDTPENHRRLREAYLRHLPGCLAVAKGRILPGIAELLCRLHPREDIVLGLLTGNLRDGARVKLGHFGLHEYFVLGGYGDHHLERDDVAREALAELRGRCADRVRPENVWVIGDTPLDIRCARAIGVRVAAVCTGWHPREELAPHGPDLLLDDLSVPDELLSRWR